MYHFPHGKRRRHPQETANFVSQLFFLFTAIFFQKGYRRGLENEDLYDAPSSFKSKKLADNFETLWRQHKEPSVLKLFLHSHGLCYFLLGLSQIIVKTFLIVIRPFLVDKFASFFTPEHKLAESSPGLFGFSIVILVLAQCWYDQWYQYKLGSLEIRVRTAFSALFYRKILRLSSVCMENTSAGEIMTLITKDVNNIEVCIRNANKIWTSTFQTFILFYLLFTKVGFFVLVSVFVAVLLPSQVRLALKCAALKGKMLKETDFRLQTIKDVLVNLKVVKSNSLESFFATKLHNFRMKEIHFTHQIFFLKLIIYINGFMWISATFFVLMTLFIVLGKEVTSEFTFFIFDAYRNLGYLVTIVIPLSLCDFSQATATMERVNKFLAMKEPLPVLQSTTSTKILMKDVGVTIKKEQILHEVNLDLNHGMVLITGPISSGKTVLVKTILGECELTKGKVVVEGSVSYASQKPWLFFGTLRQNIIFGENFDERRYNRVLIACDLINDFQWFPHGDLTVINNGTILSNSQKVRVNLARALYKNSDIYILDDFLGSLDPFMREYIITQCVAKFFPNKLVLLVTQDTHLFTESQTIVLGDGVISPLKTQRTNAASHKDVLHFPENDSTNFIEDVTEESKLLPTVPEKNIYQECNKLGAVSYNVYNFWWQCGGGFMLFVLVIFLLLCISVSVMLLEESMLFWSNNEEKLTKFTKLNLTHTSMFQEVLQQRKNVISLLIFLLVVLLVVTLGFGVTFLSFAKRASVKVHDIVIDWVLSVNLHFLDATVGNILNRLSKDLLIVDETLPFLFYYLFKMVVPMVSVTVFIVPVQTIFLVSLTLLFFILLFVKTKYVSVGRNLKRLEASSRTAIISYFNATMDGITTIKAQKCENRLQAEFETHLNLHISASFTYLCITRAFCLAVGWISSIFVGIVISQFLALGTDSTTASLTVFQSLLLVEISSTIFLNWAEIETCMTCQERILQLTEMRQEHRCGLVEETREIFGQVALQNVYLIYHGLSRPVLKNVSFIIQPREKIGIVGRNNAGKSSLIYALLGMAQFSGRISVDDVDTKTMYLDNLRSNISVILEDHVVFKGSVRENLDPFNKYTNNDLWDALDMVNLKKFVWDLKVNVTETYIAHNVSRQQRLCLAKIIVEKKNVVILDDFLKNVDEDTEMLMLNIFGTVFKNSILLIVTLNEKILSSCDRVLVLDDGEIVEFDSFSALRHNQNGLMYQLVCRSTSLKSLSN